jgi:hypothetical protein
MNPPICVQVVYALNHQTAAGPSPSPPGSVYTRLVFLSPPSCFCVHYRRGSQRLLCRKRSYSHSQCVYMSGPPLAVSTLSRTLLHAAEASLDGVARAKEWCRVSFEGWGVGRSCRTERTPGQRAGLSRHLTDVRGGMVAAIGAGEVPTSGGVDGDLSSNGRSAASAADR